MITAIEYIQEDANGVERSFVADKRFDVRPAYHLQTIEGTGYPDVSGIGDTAFGVAGSSYMGIETGARDMSANIYADGWSTEGAQSLLDDMGRIATIGSDALGVLRLRNASGVWRRCDARAVSLEVKDWHRRTALAEIGFWAPYAYFESDELHSQPIYTMTDGKTWDLERPYKFGNVVTASGAQTLTLVNEGDVAAPVIFRLMGSNLQSVTIKNNTTGAEVTASGFSGMSGIVINTDPNHTSATFADGGDASRYVSLFSYISDFKLAAGANSVTVTMAATSVQPSATYIEWRGRYSTCL